MNVKRAHSKVFCIVPPTGRLVREDRCQTPVENLKTIALRAPIDLMYAAGAFETAGCEVRLVDYPAEGWSWERLRADLLDLRPTEVLLSITTVSLERDLKAAAFVKGVLPEARVAAKGAHFNVLDEEVLKRALGLDLVLRGEYENTCAEIGAGIPLERIAGITWRAPDGGVVRNGERPFEARLDSFARPARHLTNNSLYIRPDTREPQTTIVTNRGCPFHCTYCLANQVAGTRNRYRSVQSVIEEVKECVSKFGIRSFLFRSELFTQNEKWVLDLCEAIRAAGLLISWACNSRVDTLSEKMLRAMKQAGCWIIAFGVESGDQETLDRLAKRARVEEAHAAVALTRKLGIKSSIYLLIGLPWDTAESIAQQRRFALELDPDVLEVFYPYPFPGTPLRAEAIAQGLLAESNFPEQAYSEPVMPTASLSIQELRLLRVGILKSFYVRPRIIARTLSGVRSFSEFRNYVQVGAAQLRSLWAI